ncbi:hypothetical protein NQZ79_g8904 [Umbelopsis isabellina]|nr:hypothetical protein NQZ79_g8904 [Umbelopsis isabellina]
MTYDSVPPNQHAAVSDIEAAEGTGSNVADFRKEFDIDVEKQVRLVKISHMRYQHPNLEEITQFLLDFGMTIAKQTDDKIWFRGYSTDQYVYYAQRGPKQFLGGTYEVESYEDLKKAEKLVGASAIEELKDAPGGGHFVRVIDPSGFPVNLLYGQTAVAKGKTPSKVSANYTDDKPRKRAFQRFTPGPAAVHKLGHYGLSVTDLKGQLEFYFKNFNFIPTDYLYVEVEGVMHRVSVFAHIDRGDEYVDHHTFFLSHAATNHVHHCSFEVHDFDTQELGHQWLASKGYKSVWGVGRHILGSQIFDYWWDTNGNMIEHYTDGDLVNDQTPINSVPAGSESLAVWGPELPKDFLA